MRHRGRRATKKGVRIGWGESSTPGPQVEVEVKLQGAEARIAEELAQIGQLGPYRLGDGGVDRLETTYLDTREFSLTRGGIVLRLRRSSQGISASIKWMGQTRGALHERPELEVRLRRMPPLPWRELPRDLSAYLAVYRAGRALFPVLSTQVRRRRLYVQRGRGGGHGSAVAEIACDSVEIAAPGKDSPPLEYHELEVEQRPGSRADELMEIASLLVHRFHLREAGGSKFETGMRHFYPSGLWQRSLERVLGGLGKQGTAWNLWRRGDVGVRLGREDALDDLLSGVTAFLQYRQRGGAGASVLEDLVWLEEQVAAVAGLKAAAAAASGGQPARASVAPAVHRRLALLHRRFLRLLDSPRYLRLVRRCEREVYGVRLLQAGG